MDFQILNARIQRPENLQIDQIKSFDFETKLDMRFNLEEELIKSILDVEIATKSEPEQEEANTFYQLEFVFKYEGLQEMLMSNEPYEATPHPHLGNAISSITYSTARGILMARFQGTAFSSFILPVINLNQLLTEHVANKGQ